MRQNIALDNISVIIHYSLALRTLHWLTVLGLLIAYLSIELRALVDLTPTQRKLVAFTHVYAGVSVLGMMISRLVLRLQQPAGRRTATVGWQLWAARAVHSVLYVLFIALPLLSISARYFRGNAWSFFGVPMPITAHPDTVTAKVLMSWHVDLANFGYWLIALHALAALFHHCVLKDNTLRAILPWAIKRVGNDK